MGERKLLAALTALTFVVATAAQGPVYRERWSYMHLERLRGDIWRELTDRDTATQLRVADLLAEPAGGQPFLPAARALAHLRGVPADDAFILRATLGVYLLPEVIDPVGRNENCRRLNATLFLPFTVAQPGALDFVATVTGPTGERVFETTVEKDTDVADLRRARPVVNVPCNELPDGAYELEVVARIDGALARPKDPALRLTFHVLRGYQQRSEGSMNATRDMNEQLDPLTRTQLLGLGAEVSRAYNGEAFSGQSQAVVDLVRLETALANIADESPVLRGLSGDVPIMLPVGEPPLRAVLRIDAERHPVTVKQPQPLVVFAGGLPAYDVMASRPSAPGSQGPRSLAAVLPRFGQNESWHVAFVESPGNGRNYGNELAAAIAALRQLMPTGERPVVLVCSREAAAVSALAIAKLRPQIDGLVLVGAGGMTARGIEALGDLPVRLAPLAGYPSSNSLARVLEYVDHRSSTGSFHGDLGRLDGAGAEPAWLFGLQQLAGPIAAFVREVATDG